MRCLFLASGSGGDYLALERAKEFGRIHYETSLLVNTCAEGACLEHARHRSNPFRILSPKSIGRSAFNEALIDIFESTPFDLCFLAGFRYLLPGEITKQFDKKIINSHHSILPAHPGLFRKEAVVGSDVKLLGATVHYVDSGVDSGEILCQAAFPNYGMTAFEMTLAYYRRVQDVLALSAFRIVTNEPFGPRCTVFGEALFWPAPDMGDVELFFPEEEILA